MASKDYDWRNKKVWKYKGGDNPTTDPKYIKDRSKLFAENGNGWWWYEGGMKIKYQKKYL